MIKVVADSTVDAPLDSTLTLVQRARGGDRAALEQIFERYRSPLVRLAHGRLPARARGMVDTDDLVQGAMERTFARLDRIDSSLHGSLLAYLRCAVLNQIRDEIRRARRRPQHDALTEDMLAIDCDPLAAAISNQNRARYEHALAGLPADQQEAFIMRIEMVCSYRDIATSLGRPSAEAARMLVRRAVATLAGMLTEPVRA